MRPQFSRQGHLIDDSTTQTGIDVPEHNVGFRVHSERLTSGCNRGVEPVVGAVEAGPCLLKAVCQFAIASLLQGAQHLAFLHRQPQHFLHTLSRARQTGCSRYLCGGSEDTRTSAWYFARASNAILRMKLWQWHPTSRAKAAFIARALADSSHPALLSVHQCT